MGRRIASIALSAMLMLTLSSCLVVRAGGGLGGGGLGGWNGGGWGGTGWRTTADRDDTIIYRCDDNRRFAARFEGDRAIVRAGDDRYQLQRSGPRRWRNGGGSVVLRAEGQRAELRVGERDYEDCRGDFQRVDDDDGRRRSFAYRCDDDRGFRAAFAGDRAVVEARDRRYRLARTGSNSWRSRDGDVRLVADGSRAELRLGDRRYRDCRAFG